MASRVHVKVVRYNRSDAQETLAEIVMPADLVPKQGDFFQFKTGPDCSHSSRVSDVRWDHRSYQEDEDNCRRGEEPDTTKVKVEVHVH